MGKGAWGADSAGRYLRVRLSGSRVGAGTATAISIVDDGDGNGVLRVVDAAPFAYNSVEDALQVAISKNIVLYNTPQGGVVAAGAGIDTTLTPPAGKMWRWLGMKLQAGAPAGAASGTHRIEGFIGAAKQMPVFSFVANFGKSVIFRNGHVPTGTTDVQAEPPNAQAAILNQLMWTADVPLVIRYQNDTDVSQGVQRIVQLLIEETPLL